MSIEAKNGIEEISNYEEAISFLNLYGPEVCLRMIPEDKQKEFLELSNNDGWTVAHTMAFKGYEFIDSEILKLANKGGWTVAHTMAFKGYEFTDPEILMLATKNGETVAHEMAARDHIITDPEKL